MGGAPNPGSERTRAADAAAKEAARRRACSVIKGSAPASPASSTGGWPVTIAVFAAVVYFTHRAMRQSQASMARVLHKGGGEAQVRKLIQDELRTEQHHLCAHGTRTRFPAARSQGSTASPRRE